MNKNIKFIKSLYEEKGNFSFDAKLKFFKRKWMQDHKFLLGSLFIAAILLMIAAVAEKNALAAFILPLFILASYGISNCSLMAYLEKHLI